MRDVRAIVTERGAGCDGPLWASGDFFTGRNVRGGRRNRVVLAPRPWRYVGGRFAADYGGKKGRSPGRSRISRKTIARGKPGCPGCTCQTRVHSTHYLAHGDAGAVGARLSLRPCVPEICQNVTTGGSHQPPVAGTEPVAPKGERA